jgi:hypothetical protein
MSYPAVCKEKAQLIVWNGVKEMEARLGNPRESRSSSQMRRQGSGFSSFNAIPSDACQLVLLNIYDCAVPNQQHTNNIIAVTVLKKRGEKLSGWEKAYFPVHQIREWLKIHCAMTQRKKHCLSILRSRR